ncbi:PQQ-dependent sugar dehydrogenase [Roseomonas sp. OT10]|uniref:PQQ-dependent sugar dehydrogenase n=1 Tax=Roseomonas cutis TaxID=2897332 RepID=UPI001E44BB02|nr:PQQ-dependent sugar dehydrogenase [Roseomonas sp. OT10]UFN51228.1 PQQ-dependent sugar dehydrogenase [Roseomonas sp. OT10]
MSLPRPALARRAGGALLAGLLALAGCAVPVDAQEVVRGERASFRVATFATGLEHPWGGAFLPDGRLLVTERPGRLRLVGTDGRVSAPLRGVPPVVASGQGGLLDIRLAPDFDRSRELYLCLAGEASGGVLTRLVRARLAGDATALEEVRTLLDATPAQSQGRGHYGCRIAFGTDGKLYLTTGDRQRNKMRAQDPGDLAGKLLRLERDGRPAAGNPFLGQAGVRPEIYAMGLRSPQGLVLNPTTGRLWEVEMGPRGGDEVNLVSPGANYGWPIIGRGVDYDGNRIHEAATRPGMADPLRWWVPSISPSGAAFYDGDRFPGWKGSLFLAGLNPPNLTRLTTEGDRVTGEERVLANPPRLRQVLQGPDGLLYLLTDESDGRILRLEPAG